MNILITICSVLIVSAILVESIKSRNITRVKSQRNNSFPIYFHPTNLKCSFNSKYIKNPKCHFKPTRDGAGLASMSGETKVVLYDVWLKEEMYYKYRVYRPWMISFDEDLCGIWEGTVKPGVIMEHFLTKDALENRENKPCPFFGVVGHDNYTLNLNRFVSQSYPQVLPTGDYRIYGRLHNRVNETYAEIMIQGHISANEVMDSYSMR